jgi:hypothetical protein
LNPNEFYLFLGPITNLSFGQKLKNFARKIINSIRTLNLFRRSPPSNDEYQLKTEKISTFVYIILLIIGCLVLLVFIATQTVSQIITIKTPSSNEYQTLYDQQHEKLSCPCSTITSEYADFLWINPVFHPICTSDFVHDNWIKYMISHNYFVHLFDFRFRANAAFHVLASFCSLANSTISNSMITFNSTKMISVELLSEDLFNERTQQFFNAFIQSTTTRFSYGIDSISTNIRSNFVMSGFSTNSFAVFQGSYPSFDIIIYRMGYDDCFCSAAYKCSSNALIYSNNGTYLNIIYTIPGFYIGCYIDESVRKSTLECYFNQSCVDEFKFYLNSSKSFDPKSLDPNAINAYNIKSPVDDLVKKLMVDRWLPNDSFENYYRKCRPSSCSYTLIRKTPFIVIVTTLIGLFGGLVKALRITVPLILKLVRRRRQPPGPRLSKCLRKG